MKRLLIGIFFAVARLAAAADPIVLGEEMEFSIEGSFRDGTLVRILVVTGKILIYSYSVPRVIVADEEVYSRSQKKPLKSGLISNGEYAALVSALESPELRIESEQSRVGPDGETWTFRRKAGGRNVELTLWSPSGNGSAAVALGKRLLELAERQESVKESNPSAPLTPGGPTLRHP